jgi:ATP-binding cassette, subfamily F, member 3
LPGFCFIYIANETLGYYALKLPGRKDLLRRLFFPRVGRRIMIEIAVNNMVKYYGANQVLQGVSLEIRQGERVALLGNNGAGKSTLFRIIAGKEEYDQGELMIRKGVSVGYLEQNPDYTADVMVGELLYTVYGEVYAIHQEMNRLERLMEDNVSGEMLAKYGRLQQTFESRNGYVLDEQVNRVCRNLKIDQDWLAKKIQSLSGGEKTRVMLARLLLQSPEILLLDEPTNHLDVSSIEWLEEFLTGYCGTVVLISHDRFFLDQVVGRVAELIEGRVELYQGNFTYYAREKEERYRNNLKHYEDEQRQIQRLEVAAKRMHEWAKAADNPNMHRQAFSIEKRIARMAKTEKPLSEKLLKKQFSDYSFSGSELIYLQELIKSFNGQPVLRGLDLLVRKGERVAVLGANGSGKSTLLKIITGELVPDSGVVKIGTSIRYAYLPQMVTFLNPELTMLETVRTELRNSEEQARRILAQFNFRAEAVKKPTGTLSGGEKSRLKLCLLMQRDINLLLLDEPTNHLDIASRQWLEAALDDFEGAIVFVSHDRYFINRFATRIAELNQGVFRDFHGNYDFYKGQKQELAFEKPLPSERETRKILKKNAAVKTNRAPDIKLEDRIDEWEAKLTLVYKEMELHGKNYERLVSLSKDRVEIEAEIKHLYELWVARGE